VNALEPRRADGRLYDELRAVDITLDFIDTAPGAVLIEMGRTRVICTVSVEDRVPPFLVGSGGGWLTAEYGMLPGSSGKRIARESSTGKVNGRTREIQRLIGRSLRSTLDLESLGERTLHIDCDVIQADGGTRTAAITGSYVALAQAVERLIKDNVLTISPLIGRAAAISIGLVEDCVLLDLDYGEDSRAQADMNLVMDGEQGILEIQGTAEGRPYSRQEAERMLDVGTAGIERLLLLQQEAADSHRTDSA
jgi:ribonuclease PH